MYFSDAQDICWSPEYGIRTNTDVDDVEFYANLEPVTRIEVHTTQYAVTGYVSFLWSHASFYLFAQLLHLIGRLISFPVFSRDIIDC